MSDTITPKKVFNEYEYDDTTYINLRDEEKSNKIRTELLKYEEIIVHKLDFNPIVAPIGYSPVLAYYFIEEAIDLINMSYNYMLAVEPDKSYLKKARCKLERASSMLSSLNCLIEFQRDAIMDISNELYKMFNIFVKTNELPSIMDKLLGMTESMKVCEKKERYCIVVSKNIFPTKYGKDETRVELFFDYVVIEIPIEILVKNFSLYIRTNGNNLMIQDNTDYTLESVKYDEEPLARHIMSYNSLLLETGANTRHRQLLRIVE
jgi:hypothetical protein